MKLADLKHLHESLIDLWDFVSSACDGDESGIYEEMGIHCAKSIEIVRKDRDKILLRNAKARLKRK